MIHGHEKRELLLDQESSREADGVLDEVGEEADVFYFRDLDGVFGDFVVSREA